MIRCKQYTNLFKVLRTLVQIFMMLQIDTDSPTKQKSILYADGDAEHYLNIPHLSLCHVQRGNILVSSESISNLEGVFINS